MDKQEIRKVVLGVIINKKKGYSNNVDIMDIQRGLDCFINKSNEITDLVDVDTKLLVIANEVMWDLVFERVISPAMYPAGKDGSQDFMILDEQKVINCINSL
jgi:hypothetical protein